MYRIDVLTGDYTITGENKKLNRISKNKAISIVKGLEAKIISLNARYHKEITSLLPDIGNPKTTKTIENEKAKTTKCCIFQNLIS